jgi:hypothetical protein
LFCFDSHHFNIPLILVKLSRELYGCAFQESHNLDSALKTSDEQTLDWDLPANELIRVRPETDDEDEEDVVDASNENEPVCIVPLTALQDLKECYHPHPGQLDQYLSISAGYSFIKP